MKKELEKNKEDATSLYNSLLINWHKVCHPLIFVHNISQESIFAKLIFGDKVDNWMGVLN
jgi:hypothetical protein